MSSVIHGASHKAIKFLRKNPASISVYWIYASRTNHEGVAWPTVAGLARDTAWSKTSCEKARTWLVQHEALEIVKDYTRPEWRNLPAKERAQKQNFDKSEYYRPTGYIKVDGVVYPMLYHGQREQSDIEEFTDVLPRMTSDGNGHQTVLDILPDSTELNTIDSELDSRKETALEKTPTPYILPVTNIAPSIADAVPDAKLNPHKQKRKTAPKADPQWLDMWKATVEHELNFYGKKCKQLIAVVQGACTDDYLREYNFTEPLTEPAQIVTFKRWWELDMKSRGSKNPKLSTSVATVVSEMLRWQASLKQPDNKLIVYSEPIGGVLDGLDFAS